jgi:hypothetical protein
MNVLMLERSHTRIIHVVNNFLAEWYVDLKVDGLLITCPQSVLLVLLVKLPINFLRLRFLSLLYFLIPLIWCHIFLLWRWLLLLILKGKILVLE